MIAERIVFADAAVSLAAFAGIAALIALIRSRSFIDPLSRRFLFGLQVMAIMLGARVADWLTDFGLFDFISVAAAGFIPLVALLLTEGLLRRHAPLVLKLYAAVGAALFIVLAFLPESVAEPWRMTTMLAFQFGMFLGTGWLVITRDKTSLSAAENRTVERLALSLLVILPVLATDFRSPFIDFPIRLGGVAILVLCWLAVGLERRSVTHRDTMAALGIFVVSALLAGGAIALSTGLDWLGLVQTVAIVLSASLAAAIYNDTLTLRVEDRRDSLIRHLADGDISTASAFLIGLQNHSLVEGALILEDSDLADFDVPILRSAFQIAPICNAATAKAEILDEPQREQIVWLLEKYEATHVLLASEQPLTLVALNMPSLAATPGADAELKAVQRMALLIAQRSDT